jgi:phosphate-selective porin OprO and OprP
MLGFRTNVPLIAPFSVFLLVISGLLLEVMPTTSLGQSIESDLAPPQGQFVLPPSTDPPMTYRFPDVPHTIADRLKIDRPWFTATPGMVLIVDYNAFGQDANSLAQVGKQRDQWDDRAVRFMLRGKMGLNYKVGYLFAAEYKGFDSEPGTNWNLTDLALNFPINGPETTLAIGKIKETFAYEMVGDAANLPPQERILNPFFVSRNVGLRVNRVIGEDHFGTFAAGVFNQGWGKSDAVDNGTDFTTRFTLLLWDRNEDRDYFHLGFATRLATATDGTLRFKGRPESNVASNYVDTGNILADDAWYTGLEMLWNQGPFSVLGEYTRAWVRSAPTNNPEFYGYYVVGSWVLTGENRPYDRTVAYARRIIPQNEYGAFELVSRFSNINLDDDFVEGGELYKTYLGLNWWATRRSKLGIGWGHAWLDRFGIRGETDSAQFRMQYVY